jgi:uncharacterized protein involved in propanediol utilization
MTPTHVSSRPHSTHRPRPRRIDRGWIVVAGHHGEILQGIFADTDGSVHRGLVTLRCPLFASRAAFVADSTLVGGADGRHRVLVRPATKRKAQRAAELALAHLGCETGGTLTIETHAFEGWGLGSSTSDVTAAILAVEKALGADLAQDDVARLAVSAEGAVDSLMFDGDAVLFAHREGRVLERFAHPLPPLAVVGLNPAPGTPGVDTLQLRPAAYPPGDVLVFEELRAKLRRAIEAQDPGRLGEVATASAIINQRYLPVPYFGTLLRVARASGAVGLQVAHSGRVVGLLFDATAPDCAEATSRAEQSLARSVPGHLRWLFYTRREASPSGRGEER